MEKKKKKLLPQLSHSHFLSRPEALSEVQNIFKKMVKL